jgi:cephalosporin hydroxylase
MRDFTTAFPSKFLSDYQAGTMDWKYKGIPCLKNPIDLAVYLRLIWDMKPQGIIEVGSNAGGSALWLADTLRAYRLSSPVVSIDIRPPAGISDPQVTFLRGDVHNLGKVLTADFLAKIVHPWLVIEDSAHTFTGCSSALRFFAETMRKGDVLVIEDGVIDDLGLTEAYDGGPNRAVSEFLENNAGVFEIQTRYCDMFGRNATYNPNGYLRKA